MTINLAAKESPLVQSAQEAIPYKFTTTPWGSTPTVSSVKLYEGAARTDRSSTMLSGSASVTGDIITTPIVTGLTSGQYYSLEVIFVVSGNTFKPHVIIEAVT